MNPFLAADAELYARARPRYQESVLAAAAEILELDPARRVELGVDVGCGTGHSSTALAAYARRVIALDVAPRMLAAAEGRLRFVSWLRPRSGCLSAPDESTF